MTTGRAVERDVRTLERDMAEYTDKRVVRLLGGGKTSWMVACDKIDFSVDLEFAGDRIRGYAGGIFIEESVGPLQQVVVVDGFAAVVKRYAGFVSLQLTRIKA